MIRTERTIKQRRLISYCMVLSYSAVSIKNNVRQPLPPRARDLFLPNTGLTEKILATRRPGSLSWPGPRVVYWGGGRRSGPIVRTKGQNLFGSIAGTRKSYWQTTSPHIYFYLDGHEVQRYLIYGSFCILTWCFRLRSMPSGNGTLWFRSGTRRADIRLPESLPQRPHRELFTSTI